MSELALIKEQTLTNIGDAIREKLIPPIKSILRICLKNQKYSDWNQSERFIDKDI